MLPHTLICVIIIYLEFTKSIMVTIHHFETVYSLNYVFTRRPICHASWQGRIPCPSQDVTGEEWCERWMGRPFWLDTFWGGLPHWLGHEVPDQIHWGKGICIDRSFDCQNDQYVFEKCYPFKYTNSKYVNFVTKLVCDLKNTYFALQLNGYSASIYYL